MKLFFLTILRSMWLFSAHLFLFMGLLCSSSLYAGELHLIPQHVCSNDSASDQSCLAHVADNKNADIFQKTHVTKVQMLSDRAHGFIVIVRGELSPALRVDYLKDNKIESIFLFKDSADRMGITLAELSDALLMSKSKSIIKTVTAEPHRGIVMAIEKMAAEKHL